MNRLDALKLRESEVAHAAVAHLAFADQLRDRTPAFFDVFVRLRPMDLVEVDDVDAEPTQAGFHFVADALAFEPRNDLPLIVPAAFALRGDERTPAQALERAADHFLAMAEAIDWRGVNPVDAEIEPFANGANRCVVVLRSPTEFPTAAAHRPSAEADTGEVQVGVSKSFGLHGWQEYWRLARHAEAEADF